MRKLRGRVARNDFERSDFRQAREDLVLDPLGAERVLLVAAQIFKRQNRDRLNRQGRRASLFILRDSFPRWQNPQRETMSCVAAEEKQTGQEDRADGDHVDPGFAV